MDMIDMSKQKRRKKRGNSNSGRAMSGCARRITRNTPISSSSISAGGVRLNKSMPAGRKGDFTRVEILRGWFMLALQTK